METSAWYKPNLFDFFVYCKLQLETLVMQTKLGIEFFLTCESL